MGHGPQIGVGANGLFLALAAQRRGDAVPLLRWHGEPRTNLRLALTGWCRDPELADAVLASIVVAAYQAGEKTVGVTNESAWISCVATRHYLRTVRDQMRSSELARRYAAELPRSSACPSTSDADADSVPNALRVRTAIARLPPPYRQSMALIHVCGYQREPVAGWLMLWCPITRDGAHFLLKEGRKMLEAALREQEPQLRWPRRYPGKAKWRTTPPPPPRVLEGERSVTTEGSERRGHQQFRHVVLNV
jgi:DNA-directed RNA polymerase specialized sigma24 family protein